jgi:epoxyqueuosine reductase
MATTLGDNAPTGELSAAPLKAKAAELGFDACGVCPAEPPKGIVHYRRWLAKGFHGQMEYLRRHLPLKSDPVALLPGAESVVAVSMNYFTQRSSRKGTAKIARYALGRDYHRVMRPRLNALGEWMTSVYGPHSFRVCVDSAPVLEREFAHLAGLGWFGKNTMLIDSRRGSWFFLGLLLTTLRLPPDGPSLGSCGKCLRCVEACPTGAIVFDDGRWQVNARRCVSYLTIEHRGPIDDELRRGIGEWTFGCDVCQEVCPFNSERESQPDRSRQSSEPGFRRFRDWPMLSELATISESEWDGLTRGSAVRRCGWEGIKRNAAINLANASEPPNGVSEPVLDG